MKSKKMLKIVAALVLSIVVLVVGSFIVVPSIPKYIEGQLSYASKDYEKAAEIFADLGNFSDSVEMTQKSKYNIALKYFNDEEYVTAYFLLKDEIIQSFDTEGLLEKCVEFLDEKWSGTYRGSDSSSGWNILRTITIDFTSSNIVWSTFIYGTDYEETLKNCIFKTDDTFSCITNGNNYDEKVKIWFEGDDLHAKSERLVEFIYEKDSD